MKNNKQIEKWAKMILNESLQEDIEGSGVDTGMKDKRNQTSSQDQKLIAKLIDEIKSTNPYEMMELLILILINGSKTSKVNDVLQHIEELSNKSWAKRSENIHALLSDIHYLYSIIGTNP